MLRKQLRVYRVERTLRIMFLVEKTKKMQMTDRLEWSLGTVSLNQMP